MEHEPRTLILIDPTSPEGENGLHLLEPTGGAVTLLLLLDDPSSSAVADFAAAENISIGEAAGRYLDQ